MVFASSPGAGLAGILLPLEEVFRNECTAGEQKDLIGKITQGKIAMSLYSALRSGISALNAQSQAVSVVSDNITNVNTTAFKATRTRFSSLVSSGTSGGAAAGIVAAIADRSVSSGQISTSNIDTHLAINGNGFFTVAQADDVYLDQNTGLWKTNGKILYTRVGDFQPDANGNLRNSVGHVLLGWQRNESNTGYDVSNLPGTFTAINVSAVGEPEATRNVTLNANLSASMKDGDIYSMIVPIYSKQGSLSKMQVRFTKIGDGGTDFRVETRMVDGQAMFETVPRNSLTTRTFPGIVWDRFVDGQQAPVYFRGGYVEQDNHKISLTYNAEIEHFPGSSFTDFKYEYQKEPGGDFVRAYATGMEIKGGKLTLTFDEPVPENVHHLRVYSDTTTRLVQYKTSTGSPLVESQGGVRSLAIPSTETDSFDVNSPINHVNSGLISPFLNLGILSFSASGINPQTVDNRPVGLQHAAINFVNGGFKLNIDHSADGEASTFGDDDVEITLNLKSTGSSAGMTSFQGLSTIYSQYQDGNVAGQLQELSFNAKGELQAIFTRGSPKFLAQVPLVVFNNPKEMIAVDGNAFIASDEAGVAVSRTAGSSSTGSLIGASLEQSNVDMSHEFTEMIIAQRAYSAATKIITTSDEMLEEVIRTRR